MPRTSFATTPTSTRHADVARPSPNILLLMTDQQRHDTIAAAGYPHMITPNLDRLAREGCLFRNAYTPCPICMPARHHVLTGCTGRQHGYFGNSTRPMDAAVPTLPRMLADAGYETRAIGKMHFYPPRRHHGFDRMELMEESPVTREADEYAMHLKSVGLGHIQNTHGIRNLLYEAPQRSLVPHEHHGSTWVADRTIAFLESNRGRQPFFCWSSWIAPHPPLNVPSAVADLYSERQLPEPARSVTEPNMFTRIMSDDHTYPPPAAREQFMRRRREVYYAQITYIDQQIGRIYETLKRHGLLDNTLIIFTSDHGEMLGDHGSHQKAQPYDGATRIPMIVRYPDRMTAGSERSDFVDLNDILPTVLDIAGVSHPRPEILAGGSIFRKDKDRSTQYTSLGTQGRRWVCVHDGKHKYTYYYGLDHEDLFDMQADPDETTNLTITHPHDPSVATVRDRLHRLATTYEQRWGPLQHCDEHGQLRRFAPPADSTPAAHYHARASQFPRWVNKIVDPAERAQITPYADEALQAIRDEPVSTLDHLDISTWHSHDDAAHPTRNDGGPK